MLSNFEQHKCRKGGGEMGRDSVTLYNSSYNLLLERNSVIYLIAQS